MERDLDEMRWEMLERAERTRSPWPLLACVFAVGMTIVLGLKSFSF